MSMYVINVSYMHSFSVYMLIDYILYKQCKMDCQYLSRLNY